jgi:triosephosphate isomerase
MQSLSSSPKFVPPLVQDGGSVKPDNAAALLRQPDVDGALVGGASLNADQFLTIVRAALPGATGAGAENSALPHGAR